MATAQQVLSIRKALVMEQLELITEAMVDHSPFTMKQVEDCECSVMHFCRAVPEENEDDHCEWSASAALILEMARRTLDARKSGEGK